MATSSFVTAAGGNAWTLVYTASGTVTIALQNRAPGRSVLIRVGASAAADDDPDAAAETLNPGEHRTIALANGDKVYARPVGNAGNAESVTVLLRA